MRIKVMLFAVLVPFVLTCGNSWAEPVKVAAIQYRAIPLNKALNTRNLKQMVSEAGQKGARLIVLPEMSTTGVNIKGTPDVGSFPAETIPGPVTGEFAALAKKYKAYIVMGLAEFDRGTNKYYNSQIVIAPSGEIIGKYRKVHLYGPDNNWASSGDLGYRSVQTELGKLGLGICYDINFPDLFDFFADNDVAIFVMSTNWIAEDAPFQYWSRLLRHKNIYFIAANNWGDDGFHFPGGSLILSPDMKTLARSGLRSNAIIYARIDIKKK